MMCRFIALGIRPAPEPAMPSSGAPAVACTKADRRAIRLLAATMDCSCVVVIHTMLTSYLNEHPELCRVVEGAKAADVIGGNSSGAREE